MTYKELSKYHENDIFIFRKGRDVTINTQKTLVLWYNKIPKNRHFEIKYVQRIPLILRIFKLFGFTYEHKDHHMIRIFSKKSLKYVRFDEDDTGYRISAHKICESPYIDVTNSFEKTVLISRGASMICHVSTIKHVDEAQDFIRDWLNQESMDVHTLHREFLEEPF